MGEELMGDENWPFSIDYCMGSRWLHHLCHSSLPELETNSTPLGSRWPWDLSQPVECGGSATVNLPTVALGEVQICLYLLEHSSLMPVSMRKVWPPRERGHVEPYWMLQPQPSFLLNVTPPCYTLSGRTTQPIPAWISDPKNSRHIKWLLL